mmetsp:Transcript_3592/g.11194  ORF Transcript_3592/g.11194 Transcript_3592/m.11194 type:complete len:300 (+) Transcript_3592:932-1831(+)
MQRTRRSRPSPRTWRARRPSASTWRRCATTCWRARRRRSRWPPSGRAGNGQSGSVSRLRWPTSTSASSRPSPGTSRRPRRTSSAGRCSTSSRRMTGSISSTRSAAGRSRWTTGARSSACSSSGAMPSRRRGRRRLPSSWVGPRWPRYARPSSRRSARGCCPKPPSTSASSTFQRACCARAPSWRSSGRHRRPPDGWPRGGKGPTAGRARRRRQGAAGEGPTGEGVRGEGSGVADVPRVGRGYGARVPEGIGAHRGPSRQAERAPLCWPWWSGWCVVIRGRLGLWGGGQKVRVFTTAGRV